MKSAPLIPFWLLLVTVAVIFAAIMATAGCSTMPLDLVAHEERHCEGYSHTGEAPFYTWTQTRAASVKPWLYVKVDDIDRTCRELGTQAQAGHRINACAKWQPINCIIYLPK